MVAMHGGLLSSRTAVAQSCIKHAILKMSHAHTLDSIQTLLPCVLEDSMWLMPLS